MVGLGPGSFCPSGYAQETGRTAGSPPTGGRCRLPASGGGMSPGFTITEAVVALGLTLMVAASFGMVFRQVRRSLDLQPELAALRLDGRQILDRIAADLLRAGGGLPAEIPVFTTLGRAGDRNPDGLDFLTLPERLAEATFEPVVGFDGREVRLGQANSRLDRGASDPGRRFVVVFNDDEMTPRWAFGEVVSVRGTGAGAGSGVLATIRAAGAQVAEVAPGGAGLAGAVVRISPRDNPWHWHFRAGVDADTFEPGSGGGLLERGLQSVLGGAIDAAVPGLGRSAVAGLAEQVASAMLENLLRKGGVEVGTPDGEEGGEGYGLFGLGQPGLVPVTRIRYWLRDATPDAPDRRRVLMRRADEDPPTPVGYVEDLQVRYVTGQNADVLLDTPPRFAGDLTSAARLRNHIVRAVDVSVQVRTVGSSGTGGASTGGLVRTYRRRVGLRVASAGVERRAWEERMQLNSLPTEIPRIGPFRFLPLPW